MHALTSDYHVSDRGSAGRVRRSSSLLPSWFFRFYVCQRLTDWEVYLFNLLRQVKHNSVIGDIIVTATRRPTVASFRRITAHLASQCNDSPRIMADIVGEELVLLLKAQGALYRIDQTDSGVAIADLRHVRADTRFRISLNDDTIYRVMENNPTMVLYFRDGLSDAVVRAYPKEEGIINVYLEPTV